MENIGFACKKKQKCLMKRKKERSTLYCNLSKITAGRKINGKQEIGGLPFKYKDFETITETSIKIIVYS